MKVHSNYKISLLICISISLVGLASEQQNSFLDGEAILSGWESSYSSIRTMRVSCVDKLLWYKEPTKKPEGIPEGADISKAIKYEYVERIEQDKYYHIRYSISEDGFDRPENLMEHAFNGKVTQEYWGSSNYGTIENGMTGRNVEKLNPLKKYMQLSKRNIKKYENRYPDGISEFAATIRSAIDTNSIHIRPNIESIAGQLCHVIDIYSDTIDPHRKMSFWIAHEKGMCLMKSQHLEGDDFFIEMEVQKITSTSDQNGNIIYYPEEATYYTNDIFGETKYELTVNEFVPNIAVNENSFRIDFPPNTEVYDKILEISYVIDNSNPIGELSSVTEVKPEDKAEEIINNQISNTKEISTDQNQVSLEVLQNNNVENNQNTFPVKQIGSSDGIVNFKNILILSVAFILVVILWNRHRIKL
ncbi:MAG: hypothetical protein JXA96_07210 [Sedimentisphaerales bacterium]|nr:hypothetical protein [Sedimentisphaerales bacterium]